MQSTLRNICLTIAYDGTNYAGWQVQPDAVTIQGTIEAAIKQLAGEEVRIHGSGRTDAGVHALGQVANFHTSSTIPPDRWRHALNGILPGDITVLSSQQEDDRFHARYSASRKRYRYLLRDAAPELPWLRTLCWSYPDVLDERAMALAAKSLLGTHDFSCFASKSSPEENNVRMVSDVVVVRQGGWPVWTPQAHWEWRSEGQLGFLVFEIEADGFLYNMVRAVVGTLVKMGRGEWTSDAMTRIIASRDRSRAGETAPPDGLYLVSVDYADEDFDAC